MEAIKFLSDYTIWLLMVIPGAALVGIIVLLLKKIVASSEELVAKSNIKIQNIIIASCIAIIITGFIALIRSYISYSMF